MQLWPGVELKIFTFHPSDNKADELMRDAVDYCRAHGCNVCYQSNPGDPKSLLLAAANLWQADMIVMGNSARSVLLKKVLGGLQAPMHLGDLLRRLSQFFSLEK